jgi:hypothetical protein
LHLREAVAVATHLAQLTHNGKRHHAGAGW